MDPLPFSQSDAKALIADPTSSLCGVFLKTLLELPLRFWQLIVALTDTDGNLIKTFQAGDKIESFAPLAEDAHRKLCNGQELSQTTYAVLYAAIGDTFATMDGQSAPASGNFRVPKCGARVALACGTLPSTLAVGLGDVGGEENHILTPAEAAVNANHTHTVGRMIDNTDDDGRFLTGTSTKTGTGRGIFGNAGTNDVGNIEDETGLALVTSGVNEDLSAGGSPHNTLPPYYGVYVYIHTGI